LQPVAIKQMLHTDQKAKEDFLNEIQLLKHVSLDANVLQYYGATIKDDYLWLVTEYMQAGTPPPTSHNGRLSSCLCSAWTQLF
jgi:serine/threonine protein kinase